MSDEQDLTFDRLQDALLCLNELVIWGARTGGPGGNWESGKAFKSLMDSLIDWILNELVEAGEGRDEINRFMAAAEEQGKRSLEHGAHFLKVHWDHIVSECGWLLKQLDEQVGACSAS